MITSNQLKYYSSLLAKKYRLKENKFIVEGERSVLEGIKSNFECEAILISKEYFERKSEVLDSFDIPREKIYTLKAGDFNKISDTKSPQGIAAVFLNRCLDIKDLSHDEANLIVILDNISDPGNLGTIIRNCDWFGITSIILSKDSAEYTNPKVLRSSMGSIFHADIFPMNNYNEINRMKSKGFVILSADIEGKNIFDYKNDKKKVIIFSNEAHGLSKDILQYVDNKVTIPKIGNAESLNVASASAVILAVLTN
jgi:TrmH family RNA methyltransferase